MAVYETPGKPSVQPLAELSKVDKVVGLMGSSSPFVRCETVDRDLPATGLKAATQTVLIYHHPGRVPRLVSREVLSRIRSVLRRVPLNSVAAACIARD